MEERLWLRELGWKMCAVIVTELLGMGMAIEPRDVMWALLGSRTEIVAPEGMRWEGTSDDRMRKSVEPVSASVSTGMDVYGDSLGGEECFDTES